MNVYSVRTVCLDEAHVCVVRGRSQPVDNQTGDDLFISGFYGTRTETSCNFLIAPSCIPDNLPSVTLKWQVIRPPPPLLQVSCWMLNSELLGGYYYWWGLGGTFCEWAEKFSVIENGESHGPWVRVNRWQRPAMSWLTLGLVSSWMTTQSQ